MSGSTVVIPTTRTQANTCDLLGLLRSGGAFRNDVVNLAGQVLGQIGGVVSHLTTLLGTVAGGAIAIVQGVIELLTNAVSAAINALIGHVQQQLTNLVRSLSVAVSDLSNSLGLVEAGCAPPQAPPSNDPCAGMQEFFGLIMGAGLTLLNIIGGTLTALLNATVGTILDVANQALGALTGAVSQITNAIAGEVSRLANAILESLALGNVFALNNLFRNPCAQGVLQQVGTPSLLSALSR